MSSEEENDDRPVSSTPEWMDERGNRNSLNSNVDFLLSSFVDGTKKKKREMDQGKRKGKDFPPNHDD